MNMGRALTIVQCSVVGIAVDGPDEPVSYFALYIKERAVIIRQHLCASRDLQAWLRMTSTASCYS